MEVGEEVIVWWPFPLLIVCNGAPFRCVATEGFDSARGDEGGGWFGRL